MGSSRCGALASGRGRERGRVGSFGCLRSRENAAVDGDGWGSLSAERSREDLELCVPSVRGRTRPWIGSSAWTGTGEEKSESPALDQSSPLCRQNGLDFGFPA